MECVECTVDVPAGLNIVTMNVQSIRDLRPSFKPATDADGQRPENDSSYHPVTSYHVFPRSA